MKNFTGILKRAEQCRRDIRYVLGIFDIIEIMKTDTYQQLSGRMSVTSVCSTISVKAPYFHRFTKLVTYRNQQEASSSEKLFPENRN